jgi:cytochrome P450
MMISGFRSELGLVLKLAEYFPMKALRDDLRINDRLEAHGLAALENHRENVTKIPEKDSASLFSKFLSTTNKQELSLPQIYSEASNLIIAGSDTTAVSLTYLVWSLLRPQNASIKEKLIKEIETLPQHACLTEISALKYLTAVINESLRLYGAAPGSLPRMTPVGGARLGEYFVPAGTTVSVQAYTLHLEQSIFADPER